MSDTVTVPRGSRDRRTRVSCPRVSHEACGAARFHGALSGGAAVPVSDTVTVPRGSRDAYAKNVSSWEYGGAQQQRMRSSLVPLFSSVCHAPAG